MAKTDDIFKKQSGHFSAICMHEEQQRELMSEVCNSRMTETAISNWAKKFFRFKEAYGKILYSKLSGYILDERKDDIIKVIEDNLKNIANYMDTSYNELGIEQYNFWLKFKDHCELAILQREHYHISTKEIEETSKTTALNSVKEETERIQKDLTSQLIGLVSIFTALSFVIFGGINILSSILENVRLASISRMLCAGIMWTISMSLLFLIFIHLILKIIKPKNNSVFSKRLMNRFCGLMGFLFLLLIAFVILDISVYNPIQKDNKEQNTEIIFQPEEVIIHDVNE